MPYFERLPAKSRLPEANWPAAFAGLVDLGQLVENQQRGNFERNLVESLIGGAGSELTVAQPAGRMGFFGPLRDAFDPKAAYTGSYANLSPITRQVLASVIESKMPGPLVAEKFGSAPWWMNPTYKNTPEGKLAMEKAVRDSESKPIEDQMRFWQSISASAAGQYYYPEGLEGGADQPKDPAMYRLAQDRLAALREQFYNNRPATTDNRGPRTLPAGQTEAIGGRTTPATELAAARRAPVTEPSEKALSDEQVISQLRGYLSQLDEQNRADLEQIIAEADPKKLRIALSRLKGLQ